MSETHDRRRRGAALGILISLASFAAIFLLVSPADILTALATASYSYLSLSIAGIGLFTIVRAARWRYLLNNKARFTSVFHIQNVGYLLSNILPFRIGDVARVFMIAGRDGVGYADATSTVVVERLLDLMFFVAVLPLTLVTVPELPGWLRSAAWSSAIMALSATVLLVVGARNSGVVSRFVRKVLVHLPFLNADAWGRRIEELFASLVPFTRFRKALAIIVATILVWLPIIYSYHMALQAVGLSPSVSMSTFVLCAAAFSVAAPSAPGQIGVFHAGVLAALATLSQPVAASAGFAFLYHAANIITMSLLGAVGLGLMGLSVPQIMAQLRTSMRSTEE